MLLSSPATTGFLVETWDPDPGPFDWSPFFVRTILSTDRSLQINTRILWLKLALIQHSSFNLLSIRLPSMKEKPHLVSMYVCRFLSTGVQTKVSCLKFIIFRVNRHSTEIEKCSIAAELFYAFIYQSVPFLVVGTNTLIATDSSFFRLKNC